MAHPCPPAEGVPLIRILAGSGEHFSLAQSSQIGLVHARRPAASMTVTLK